MFEWFKTAIRDRIVSSAIKVIEGATSDLSIQGYPDETYEIRKALYKIRVKERRNEQ